MSSGMHAYFRLVVKKIIHNRSIRQPPTTTKYIIDLDFVKMKLFDEIVPKTCRNFAELCTHQQGFGYAGSSFHHVVRGFGLYGGDIVNRVEARQPYHVDNAGLSWSGKVESWKKPEPLPMPTPELGQCGRSIYTRLKSERVYEDESFFEDESFKIQHDQAGVLTMANRGLPHTNDSRFVILTVPAPHLDQKNVAFGQVVEGMDVIHEIDKVCGSQSGHPLHYVEIVQCGVLADVEQPFPAKTALEDLNRRETRDPKAYTREPIYIE